MGRMVVSEDRKGPFHRHARGVARHQDHGLLLVFWCVRIGLTHENEYLATGISCPGRPPLVSVYDIPIAITNNAGPDVCGIRRGHVRLSHAKGGADFAFQQGLEPPLLLLLSTVANKCLHVPCIRRRAVEYLRRHRGSAHDFAKGCIFIIGQSGTILAFGQEEIPKSFFFGLLL